MPKRNKLEIIFLIFPAIYLIDLFLGFNVHLINISGIPNLILALLSMSAYALYAVLHSGVNNFRDFFRHFTKIDLVVLIFIILNLLWASLVPFITGNSLSMALSEGKVFIALFLYFPCVLLSRMGYLNWVRVIRFSLVLVSILAFLHIVLYIGEKVFDAFDYDGISDEFRGHGGFSKLFFGFLSKIRIGTTDSPQIIMGSGYIRIIYPTSVLLILGVYFVLRKADEVSVGQVTLFVIFTIAICSTLTKTLWLGVGIGILAYIICMITFLKQYRKNIIILLLAGLITVCLTNITLFDGMIISRMSNTFVIEQPDEDGEINDEAIGTAEANQIRLEQTQKLINKWLESPLFGHGYGYYIKDYFRSEIQPYSYEMLIPALLMKTGILGVAVWAAFVVFIIGYIIKRRLKQPVKAGASLFLILSFIVAVQNNPLLMNFNGMTLIVFALSDLLYVQSPAFVKESKQKKL